MYSLVWVLFQTLYMWIYIYLFFSMYIWYVYIHPLQFSIHSTLAFRFNLLMCFPPDRSRPFRLTSQQFTFSLYSLAYLPQFHANSIVLTNFKPNIRIALRCVCVCVLRFVLSSALVVRYIVSCYLICNAFCCLNFSLLLFL